MDIKDLRNVRIDQIALASIKISFREANWRIVKKEQRNEWKIITNGCTFI